MTVAVVIPALNEQGNIGRLVRETFRVVPREILGEVIIVDDGSSDGTGDEVKDLISKFPRLRYIRHRHPVGQSAAIRTGVLAAHCPIIATMDGDGQNDPADITNLLKRLDAPGQGGPAFVGGVRVRRMTKGSRRIASFLGNKARQAMLKEVVRILAAGSRSTGARHFCACLSSQACIGSCRRCSSSADIGWSSGRSTIVPV